MSGIIYRTRGQSRTTRSLFDFMRTNTSRTTKKQRLSYKQKSPHQNEKDASPPPSPESSTSSESTSSIKKTVTLTSVYGLDASELDNIRVSIEERKDYPDYSRFPIYYPDGTLTLGLQFRQLCTLVDFTTALHNQDKACMALFKVNDGVLQWFQTHLDARFRELVSVLERQLIPKMATVTTGSAARVEYQPIILKEHRMERVEIPCTQFFVARYQNNQLDESSAQPISFDSARWVLQDGRRDVQLSLLVRHLIVKPRYPNYVAMPKLNIARLIFAIPDTIEFDLILARDKKMNEWKDNNIESEDQSEEDRQEKEPQTPQVTESLTQPELLPQAVVAPPPQSQGLAPPTVQRVPSVSSVPLVPPVNPAKAFDRRSITSKINVVKATKARMRKREEEMEARGDEQDQKDESTFKRQQIPMTIKNFVKYKQLYKCVGILCKDKDILIPPAHDFDHIIPVHKGGANTANNIQCLCLNCHRYKTEADRYNIDISTCKDESEFLNLVPM